MERAHTIECPSCNFPQKVPYDNLYSHETIECKKCNIKFNVYSLYKSLYQEVTIARMIADAWSGIIYETYSIKEGSDASEKTLAEDFVNSKNFSDLFPNIVKDVIVYGDCFVEYSQSNSGALLLDRIEVVNMDITTSAYKYDYIFHMKDEKGRKIDDNKIIHFGNESITPPFGDSIFGYWFHIWYNIKGHFNKLKAVGYNERNIMTYDSLNKIRQLWERSAIIGSGLPLMLFNGYLMDSPFSSLQISMLDSGAKRIRRSIEQRN